MQNGEVEILEQNEAALLAMVPGADTGIYCAGLGRKEYNRNIIFASRDSLGNSPLVCGPFDIVIIDEAHMVSTNEDTRYQKILSAINPKYIIGLTGTPWRLDNGPIWGTTGYFDDVCFNIGMDFLIEEGFLCPYKFPKPKEVIISTEGVRKTSGGDFVNRELTEISSTEEIVSKCIDTWEKTLLWDTRKCSIFFCCSLKHAAVVTEELKKRYIKPAYIDGKTNRDERKQLMIDCKMGKYEAIVNVGCLTTGVDIKIIDCIVGLRATASASLFVQMNGRGLRTFAGKKDLLILEMTDNFQRFNSLEAPLIKEVKNHKEDNELQ